MYTRLPKPFLLVAALLLVTLLFFTAGCEQRGGSDSGGDDAGGELHQLPEDQDDLLVRVLSGQGIQNGVDSILLSRQNAITRAIERISPAVVGITVTSVEQARFTDPFFDPFFLPHLEREFTSLGSGFIISPDGYVVTNEHVIGKNSRSIRVVMSDGMTYTANLIGSDEFTDIALLKIDSDNTFPYVEFGDSDEVIVGEWAIALGNPFGLFDDGKPTVTVGVVSAVQRNFRPDPRDPRIYLDMIQTDAAINRGNSGGPLVNSDGKVIGMNTFIFTGGTSAGFVGLSFAIPSNRAAKIINELAERRQVVLTFDLGITVRSIDRLTALQFNLPSLGLLVMSVNRDGPAFEAGVRPGDVITRIGSDMVYGDMHARALLHEYSEGDRMTIELVRAGTRYETSILLRRRVSAAELTP
jgi:serine protease Do